MEDNRIIDFHAHILPGMDHGCADITMTLKQLGLAANKGIDVIVATSHFYANMESVDDFLRRREKAWNKLQNARQSMYPEVKLGAEVLAFNNIDKMPDIERLCIENTRVLLLEMPLIRRWEKKLINTVVRLRDAKGLEIILAHGERYPMKELELLIHKGFQIQLNAASLTGMFLSKAVKELIRSECVAAIGSDIHGLHNSYRAFTRSMKKQGARAENIMKKTRMLIRNS